MIAIDTNVLVRVLTNDDRIQAKRAMARLRSEPAWISRTVILETGWVLRHAYGLDAVAIGKAFSTLLGVASIEVEDRPAVLKALLWYGEGMDLADALHLALSDRARAFVTFDRELAKVAKRTGATPEVVSP